MMGAHAVPEQGLGKGPQQAPVPCRTLTLTIGILPSAAWLCVPLSLHSRDGLGDTLGDKSPLLSFIPQMFMKYLQPSDQADIILMAIKSLRAPSACSISMAAYMVDVLVADPAFQPGQASSLWVARPMLQPTGGLFLPQFHTWPALTPSQAGIPQLPSKQLPAGAGEMAILTLLTSPLPPVSPLQVPNIVWAIYRNLPSIKAVVALNSLDRALLVLLGKHPREVVSSLLQCSPTCTRYGAHQPLGLL